MKKSKIRKHIPTILIVAVFIIGVGLLLYPTVSSLWNSRVQTRAVLSYTNSASGLSDEEREALIEAAREYNSSLAGATTRFILTEDEEEEYESLLTVPGTSVIGYIEIEKINVYLPIYHGTGDDALSKGVGHLAGSSLPVGGESTHCVLSGHRGLVSSTLFTNLDQLEVGDTFVINVLDLKLTYEIDQIVTVEPDDTSELQIVEGEDYVTLLTCTPYGINSHRLLVRGHRVENASDTDAAAAGSAWFDTAQVVMVTAAVILIVLFAAVMIRGRKKRRGGDE